MKMDFCLYCAMNWDNRKFQYGDGFFETMIVRNGVISFYDTHFDRIIHACSVLKISFSPTFRSDLEKDILSKAKFDNTRVKIQFWRSGKGKYTPENNKLEYQIEVAENKLQFFRQGNSIELCKTSQVIPSPYSSFKCFLLPYIIAGVEKVEKKVDDLILLNTKKEIAESISSNIFWINNGEFFTPSLDSGCLNGVMRKQVLNLLETNNIKINEGLFLQSELKKSNYILSTNVTGIVIYNNTLDNFRNEFSFFNNLIEL